MEYTKAQAEQAIRNKFYKDMEKKIALWHHETALKWVSELNLPYRVGLDYEKELTSRSKMQIGLSIWYPLPKIPKVAELDQNEKENYRYKELWDIDNGTTWFRLTTEPTGETDKDGKTIVRFCDCKDEIYQQEQARIDEKARRKAEQHKPWNLETKQGLERWEKYFALYIVPYESVMPSWNSFNMFGDTKHTEKQLNERKAYYMDLIKRFKADTVGYFDKEPRTKQLADYDLYDFYEHGIPLPGDGFYIDIESAKNHPQALQIIQKELAMYERANATHYNYYREVEELKEIIRNLEQ